MTVYRTLRFKLEPALVRDLAFESSVLWVRDRNPTPERAGLDPLLSSIIDTFYHDLFKAFPAKAEELLTKVKRNPEKFGLQIADPQAARADADAGAPAAAAAAQHAAGANPSHQHDSGGAEGDDDDWEELVIVDNGDRRDDGDGSGDGSGSNDQGRDAPADPQSQIQSDAPQSQIQSDAPQSQNQSDSHEAWLTSSCLPVDKRFWYSGLRRTTDSLLKVGKSFTYLPQWAVDQFESDVNDLFSSVQRSLNELRVRARTSELFAFCKTAFQILEQADSQARKLQGVEGVTKDDINQVVASILHRHHRAQDPRARPCDSQIIRGEEPEESPALEAEAEGLRAQDLPGDSTTQGIHPEETSEEDSLLEALEGDSPTEEDLREAVPFEEAPTGGEQGDRNELSSLFRIRPLFSHSSFFYSPTLPS
uniref:Uncharacterized protein n=1 Tax=Chromera velia CCMP2878 TaxID=1169474 RepID=A0A0G4F7A5_9ALVE|eukprot:Cvel_15609.t1-p1 / transcript=Cvel_15609.t1 / gene=Cvel_15609 / organism=Chromera_velia_CCMP2878 / gene_product=hypothetical protein / transcript_product=hypothetical protein / location=Cvel_scaffold1161:44232-48814(+) / protein_length=420 / sequence_SO=supercontig / SO=protein_coding / is_pseudo=false